MKNQFEIIEDVLQGMIGIGGVPTNEEFYAEFNDRLKSALNIGKADICNTDKPTIRDIKRAAAIEKEMENAGLFESKEVVVEIKGCDLATGFRRVCLESELPRVAKELSDYHQLAGSLKFFWVRYSDGREDKRLDDVVTYE